MKLKLVILFSIFYSSISANVGDTTRITIYNNKQITAYGNIDTNALLPTGKQYRKILLHYILGVYQCPGGTQYCAAWDYTTQVYVRPQNADTLEIARIITPYASDWKNTNRSNDYVIDLTNYAPVLQGNTNFLYNYEGYSYGFTLTLELEFIEGTPPMNVEGIKNMYDGSFAYGSSTDLIENKLIPKTYQYGDTVKQVFLKNTVSGHGSDDSGCSEFCTKYYDLKIGDISIDRKQLWRNDCGLNDIYPQTGTWLLERGNWCPGAVVKPIYHNISFYTQPNLEFTADLDMQSYTANQSNVSASYNFSTQLFFCGDMNYSRDVSIEDIIAPSKDPNYFRSNSVCAHPLIRVKNTGKDTINSIQFSYNLVGGNIGSYTWTGILPSLKDTIIDLGSSLEVFNANTSNTFEVNITKVNNINSDENTYNNYYQSTFTSPKSYPSSFVVYFKPNNATSSNTGYNETTWKILDAEGNIVYSRINNTNSATYRDTVSLADGCYTFIADDDGCDGISWWAYSYYDPNPGTGILRFTSSSTSQLIKNFSGDFGCQLIERFTVGYALEVNEKPAITSNARIFPSPAQDELNIDFDLSGSQNVQYRIIDLSGKELFKGQIEDARSIAYPIDISQIKNGLYIISIQFENHKIIRQKFIINK